MAAHLKPACIGFRVDTYSSRVCPKFNDHHQVPPPEEAGRSLMRTQAGFHNSQTRRRIQQVEPLNSASYTFLGLVLRTEISIDFVDPPRVWHAPPVLEECFAWYQPCMDSVNLPFRWLPQRTMIIKKRESVLTTTTTFIESPIAITFVPKYM